MTAAAAFRRSRHAVHVNFTWRAPEEVTYERMTAPTPLTTSSPDGVALVYEPSTRDEPSAAAELPHVVPWHLILKTQAFQHPKEAYSRCYHFDLKGCCQRGARCAFVHVVTIGECSTSIRRRLRRRRGSNPNAPQQGAARPSSSSVSTSSEEESMSAPPKAVEKPPRLGIARTSNGSWFHDPYQLAKSVQQRAFKLAETDASSLGD